MKKRVAREPYEGYKLPASSEKGGQFVDFNKVLRMKPVKTVRRFRKR